MIDSPRECNNAPAHRKPDGQGRCFLLGEISGENAAELELYDLIQPVEPFAVDRKIGMRCKPEAAQIQQIVPDGIGQKPSGSRNKIGSQLRRRMADAPFRMLQLVRIQIKEQTAVVVKDGGHFLHLQGIVVVQNAKISAVAVNIQNQCIQKVSFRVRAWVTSR